MPKRRASRRSAKRKPTRPTREWIGGRLLSPFFVQDREEPYCPEMVVWLEQPSGLIVGQEVFAPEDTRGALARVLLVALERPAAGPRRQPGRIRVAEESFAAELREAVGDSIPITVAPTPELDDLLDEMLRSIPQEDEELSYLEEGRIPPETVAKLFDGAQLLYRAAPWKIVTDDQVLHMDIPELGVEGACVSIIGNLAQSLGIIIFPDLAGFDAVGLMAEDPLPQKGRIDLGSDWLSLSFEQEWDLPTKMRHEVETYGWSVAGKAAYPLVDRRDRDGTSRPLVERDLEIAAACATSLSAFFLKHQSLFESEDFEPVCESYFDQDDMEVRLTLPYEAFLSFDPFEDLDLELEPPAPGDWGKVGRNDPCPCGSGRKYKKCHLLLEKQERIAPPSDRHPLHDLDESLSLELIEFAPARFGAEAAGFTEDFFDASKVLDLSVPWSLYHYQVQGASVADWYLKERGARLSKARRAWLAAQRAAWLSVWEVVDIEAQGIVTLRDLLSDERRSVRETLASETLVVRDAILARVVDHDEVSLLCGVYPYPLPPLVGAEVVRLARGRLRRKRAVPVERLRDEAFGRYLIWRWEEAVEDLEVLSSIPPELHNTDGDPLLLTTDHYRLSPAARPFVEKQLASLEGVRAPDPGEDPAIYVFQRPGNRRHADWESTIVGQARFSDTTLRLESNSRERADALRRKVEAACGERIRHRAREHADPLSSKAEPVRSDQAIEPPSPEEQQLLLDYKARHYADWLDQPLPALDGKTPRETARTKQGRASVDGLLKDMENSEQRWQSNAAFDFSTIRRELGLE